MPYHHNKELPQGVQDHLPEHAQDIYREAFNSALEEYKDPQKRRDPQDDLEEIAHRVAWSAVKNLYTKGADGDWHRKEDTA